MTQLFNIEFTNEFTHGFYSAALASSALILFCRKTISIS